jgi:hypothetical protein
MLTNQNTDKPVRRGARALCVIGVAVASLGLSMGARADMSTSSAGRSPMYAVAWRRTNRRK